MTVDFGLYQPDAPGWMPDLYDAENRIGRKLDIVHWYMKLHEDYIPRHTDAVLRHGSIPLLTVEPWVNMREIVEEKHDSRIRKLGNAIREAGHKNLYIRFAHEMNGDWYPWGQNDPEIYKAGWKRFVRLISNRAPTTKFVWCPNKHYAGAPDIYNYWPGFSLVDVVGIDGYNMPHIVNEWRDPQKIFGQTLHQIRGFWRGSILVCETGCVPDRKRASWLLNMKRWANNNVDGWVYFNEEGSGDYRLTRNELAIL